MSITSISGANGSSLVSAGSTSTNRLVASRSASPADTMSRADQWAAEFHKEAKKTPLERIRERILASHHLSEADFAALPREQQAAILREIEDAVKAALKNAKSPRSRADIII